MSADQKHDLKRENAEEGDLHSAILNSMAGGVCVVRSSDLSIAYANPRLERLLGCEIAKVLSGRAVILESGSEAPPETIAVPGAAVEDLTRFGEATYELKLIRADGSATWARVTARECMHPKFGHVWILVHDDVTAARSVQEELRSQQVLLRAILDALPVGVRVLHDDGTLALRNAADQRLWGKADPSSITTSPEGRNGMSRFNWPALVYATLKGRCVTGEMANVEWAPGRVRRVLMSSAPVPQGRSSTGGAVVVSEDVSHVAELEARYWSMVASASDAILSLDDEQRIVSFNSGAERIFGYSQHEVRGMPFEKLVPEQHRMSHRTQFSRLLVDDGARLFEERRLIVARRRDGDEFPAESSISRVEGPGVKLFTVVLRDVSERHRQESAQAFLAEAGGILGASLDFPKTLSNVAELCVRFIADYCVVDLMQEDKSVRRMVATASKSGDGRLAQALQNVELDLNRPGLNSEALRTGRPVLYPEVTPELLMMLTQNEEHLSILRAMRPRSIMSVPLIARGVTLGAVLLISSRAGRTYRDWELHLAEELSWRAALAVDNAMLFQKAQQAARARDAILAMVAHDLRNPLNAVNLQAHAVAKAAVRAGKDGEPLAHSAASILTATRRMNRLISDLLDVTLMDAGAFGVAPSRCDLKALAATALEAVRGCATEHELRVELPERLPTIDADPDRLLQLLVNLLTNALKFTPPGGTVTLGAAVEEQKVRMWVADTGCGMSAEACEHVFDRFWRADRADRRGAGLGLSIVKGIAEAHGGRVDVRSQVGRGTTFTVELPSKRSDRMSTTENRIETFAQA